MFLLFFIFKIYFSWHCHAYNNFLHVQSLATVIKQVMSN